jgi:hypothetical protein
MESLEHAWDVEREQRQWPFLANSVGKYICPACRTQVKLETSVSGHTSFVHTQQVPNCQRFKGVPNLKAESKYLLLIALDDAKRRLLTVRKHCLRCNSLAVSATYEYDMVIDPLGSGVTLPADYVDDGADILLYKTGQLVASIGFSDRALRGATPASWCALEPATAINAVLKSIDSATTNELDFKSDLAGGVLLDDVRSVAECGRQECVSLKELARLLGWRRSWTSDEIDWNAKCPDVSQFIANTCTGKIRLYFEWSLVPKPLTNGMTLRSLQIEVVRRCKCLFCEQPATGVTRDWPFCAKCTPALKSQNYRQSHSAYDVTVMDTKTKQQRLERLGWVRTIPYVKKPEKSDDHKSSTHTAAAGATAGAVPVNDKPCTGCEMLEYKPLFFYGYRAICQPCLLPLFIKHFPDLVPQHEQ